jgi:UDP-glucose 4-epimerase
MLKNLIFGHRGFVGKNICNKFQTEGIPFCVADSRVTENWKLLLPSTGSIIWAAGGFNPISAELDSQQVEKHEVHWKYFIDSLIDIDFTGKLIFLSSGGCVYSEKKDVFVETDEAFGINAYGKSKARMEMVLKKSNLNYTILRVANLYGPMQPVGRGQGVIAEWIDRVKKSKPITLFGSGNYSRDFLFISDFCDAVKKVVNVDSRPGVYNLGSGVATSLNDIVGVLREQLKQELRIDFEPSRVIDRLHYCLDNSKFSNEFGWNPKIGIDLGIKLSVGRNNEG